MQEERAVLLSRLGQHEKVLNIYIKLGRVDKARDYCKSQPQLYRELFKILVKGEQLEAATVLLEKFSEHIDAVEALGVLPDETKLQRVYVPVERVMREVREYSNQARVVKGLAASEQQNVELDLATARKRVIRVVSEMTCTFCHRRLGNRYSSALTSVCLQ